MESSEIGVNRLYRHVDGGIYRTLGFTNIKMDDENGTWKKGIRYECLVGDMGECSTSIERFLSRFSPEFIERDHEVHE